MGDYASAFSHDTEQASPGYYRVTLADDGVDVELTAAAIAHAQIVAGGTLTLEVGPEPMVRPAGAPIR